MTLNYRSLFSVEILHHYYNNGKCIDFDVVPSSDCIDLLKNQHLVWRFRENKLIVAAETDPADANDSTPFIPLGDGIKFRFYLVLKNSDLLNFSNLPLEDVTNKVYYFSNLITDNNSENLFLSQFPDGFDSNAKYLMGDVTRDGNTLFECIKNTAGEPTTNTEFWKSIGNDRIVTKKDMLILTGNVFRTTIPKSSKITTDVFGLNMSDLECRYNQKVLETVVRNFRESQSRADVELFSLKPEDKRVLGSSRYKITVNGKESSVYYDQQMIRRNVFGILEIFHYTKVPDNYGLLENGKIKNRPYKLCFHNRSTIWKYLPATTAVSSVDDTSDILKFRKNGTKNEYISTKPIPLSQTPISSLVAKKANDKLEPLPNARVDRIKSTTIDDSDTKYLCSEIFLNF